LIFIDGKPSLKTDVDMNAYSNYASHYKEDIEEMSKDCFRIDRDWALKVVTKV